MTSGEGVLVATNGRRVVEDKKGFPLVVTSFAPDQSINYMNFNFVHQLFIHGLKFHNAFFAVENILN